MVSKSSPARFTPAHRSVTRSYFAFCAVFRTLGSARRSLSGFISGEPSGGRLRTLFGFLSRSTRAAMLIESLLVFLFFEARSEEHTSELQSLRHLVCRLLLGKKNNTRVMMYA